MSRVLTLLAGVVVAACGSSATGSMTAAPPGASAVPTLAPSAPSSGPTASSPAPTTIAAQPIRIPLSGAAPDAIFLDGSSAWVLAGEGGSLMEVNLAAGREVRAIQVGFGATHLARPLDGTFAVARFSDAGTGTYLQLVDVQSGDVAGVKGGELAAMTSDGQGIVWALEKSGRLLKVNAKDPPAVLAVLPVTVGQNVHIEVQWGAGSVWVGSDGLPVTRFGGETLALEKTIEVPSGIPFEFDRGLVWGAGPTDLWAIDPDSNEITQRIELENVSEILGLDIDGTDAWLAVRRPGQVGAVLHLDLGAGALVEEFPVSLPAAVKLDAAHAWVASYLTNELLGFAR